MISNALRQLQNFINPYPPYFVRKNDNKLEVASRHMLDALPTAKLSSETEFTLCAIAITMGNLHPEMVGTWHTFMPRFQEHWQAIKLQTDRAGMNDYHIVAWSINGRVEHLHELMHQKGRRTVRGKTAVWAIDNLSKHCPEFKAAITALQSETA